MKKVLFAVLVGLMLLGVTTAAHAVVLLPGGSILTTGAASPGTGVAVASIINAPWSTAGGATGTFSQWVRNSGTGLVFEYQFTNSASSSISVTQLASNFFGGFTTNVDAFPLPNDPASNGISRSAGNGTAITFAYFNDQVMPGETSQLLWVQTDAQRFGAGETGIIAGTTQNLFSYGPAVIPEPASMMLLGFSLVGLGAGKLRRKKV